MFLMAGAYQRMVVPQDSFQINGVPTISHLHLHANASKVPAFTVIFSNAVTSHSLLARLGAFGCKLCPETRVISNSYDHCLPIHREKFSFGSLTTFAGPLRKFVPSATS